MTTSHMSSTFFNSNQRLLEQDGSYVLASHALSEASYVLVYFCGSWCEPCGEFTPMLKAFYDAYHTEKSFEVVLISFDNSEAAMMQDFTQRHGNYYCLPYADAAATRIRWMEENNVKGLPSLVVFRNGEAHAVVTPYGCNMVVSDPKGVYFPWPQSEALFRRADDTDTRSISTLTMASAGAHIRYDACLPAVEPPLLPPVATPPNFFDDPSLQLLRKDGSTVLATAALAKAAYVLVYFSAHWCPYCVEFTPLLKAFYEKHHAKKNFEVVFFSADNSQEEMWNYFQQLHGDYLCLPYDKAEEMRTEWYESYGVKGIPKLVVFEKGFPRVVVTPGGREKVEQDPEAVHFPWKAERFSPSSVLSPVSCLADMPVTVVVADAADTDGAESRTFFDSPTQQLLQQDGSLVLAKDALATADYVLVYFSAHWCPSCCHFTPLLKTFYEAHHKAKNFQVVFFSLDNSEKEMMNYFNTAHGDYYCLPFDDAKSMKKEWGALYNVEYIPTVLVFKKGYPRVLLSAKGREQVVAHPDAAGFPWPDAAARTKKKMLAVFIPLWLLFVFFRMQLDR